MTEHTRLTDPNFNRIVSLAEAEAHDANIRSNDAFVAAMARATLRKKEKAVPGTFVDHTPPIHAVRIRAEVLLSACGSPGQMCIETSGAPSGTQTLR